MDAVQIISKHLRQAVKSATNDVAVYAKNHHKFKARTGALERAVTHRESSDGMSGYVTIDRTQAPYGVYVHQGYKAYDIVPRKKLALRWVAGTQKARINGKSVKKRTFAFAKRVHHPAYQGDPFLFDALDKRTANIQKIFNDRVEAATSEITKGL